MHTAYRVNSFSKVGEEAVEYEWSDTSLTHSETGIVAMAIAPYFGRYVGKPINRNILEDWAREPDSGLDNLFEELTEGGALRRAYENMDAYAQIAQEKDI